MYVCMYECMYPPDWARAGVNQAKDLLDQNFDFLKYKDVKVPLWQKINFDVSLDIKTMLTKH